MTTNCSSHPQPRVTPIEKENGGASKDTVKMHVWLLNDVSCTTHRAWMPLMRQQFF